MQDTEKYTNFISKCKTAFIASVDANGYPNMKAMLAPRKIEGNCYYFTTNTSSMRVSQYENNPKASIYFYARGRFKYEGVMLLGEMEVLKDAQTKQEIWRGGDTMFYKGGVEDPDYCVLKFTAQSGRHYSDLSTNGFIL